MSIDYFVFNLQIFMSEIRPFVKRAWWKRWLIPQLINFFPKIFDTYIEPFVWWWALLIYILQNYDIKNVYAFDINHNLINCYNVIKNNVNPLILKLDELQEKFRWLTNEEDKKKLYMKIRTKYNSYKLKKWEENINRAAEFIFLNKTCFNWLYRENSKGEFNVPCWKSKDNPTICDKDNLLNLSKLFQNVTFIHWNYYECEKLVTKNTFVYFDPPYRPVTKAWFNSYVKESFNDESQKELAKFFAKLHKKWANLMLSNSNPKNRDPNDTFFEDIYKGFEINEVFAKRNINSDWNWRWAISELLITNYKYQCRNRLIITSDQILNSLYEILSKIYQK